MLFHATLLFLIGSLLGLRFRALALLPASIGALALASVAGDLASDSAAGIVLAIVATLLILQIGYLAGAAAAAKARHTHRAFKSRTYQTWY